LRRGFLDRASAPLRISVSTVGMKRGDHISRFLAPSSSSCEAISLKAVTNWASSSGFSGTGGGVEDAETDDVVEAVKLLGMLLLLWRLRWFRCVSARPRANSCHGPMYMEGAPLFLAHWGSMA